MDWIQQWQSKLNKQNGVAPLVRTGGSRHTGLAALPYRNIQKYGIRHTYSCRYFEYNIQNEYQRYGIKYPSKDILTWPTPNLARYNPWTVCSSAQLIIELE